MHPGVNGARRFFGAEHRAHWNPARNRLGQRGDVRLNAVVLIGAPLARAAHARLNLIHNQQRAGGVAQLPRLGEELLRQRTDAALALDRLDAESPQTSLENFARRSATSLKRTNSTPGITGAKGSRYLALCVVDTEPIRAAVKALLQREELRADLLALAAQQPACARASFSAPSHASVPVLEKKTRSMPRALCQAQREFRLSLVVEEVRRVHQRPALLCDRLARSPDARTQAH